MSLCEHGFTAFYDCPYCECPNCERSMDECRCSEQDDDPEPRFELEE